MTTTNISFHSDFRGPLTFSNPFADPLFLSLCPFLRLHFQAHHFSNTLANTTLPHVHLARPQLQLKPTICFLGVGVMLEKTTARQFGITVNSGSLAPNRPSSPEIFKICLGFSRSAQSPVLYNYIEVPTPPPQCSLHSPQVKTEAARWEFLQFPPSNPQTNNIDSLNPIP